MSDLKQEINFIFETWELTARVASNERRKNSRHLELTRRLCSFEKNMGEKLEKLKEINQNEFNCLIEKNEHIKSIWYTYSSIFVHNSSKEENLIFIE